MSKTIIEIEPSDIRLTDKDEAVTGDPVHDAVRVAAIAASIYLMLGRGGDDVDLLSRRMVAAVLNSLNRSGFVIVKKEVI